MPLPPTSRSFNPRTPCGVRRRSLQPDLAGTGFNPRTPCGVRLPVSGKRNSLTGFNPRTPCGVRRPASLRQSWKAWFQSTHSLRSATRTIRRTCSFIRVSIHALLAECDLRVVLVLHRENRFNPRTPCGVRLDGRPNAGELEKFQSTHSLRSATIVIRGTLPEPKVSIHALLAECDYSDT